jgi:hypothetical protein
MRNLVIGPDERLLLDTLRQHAEDNVLSFDDLLDIKNGQAMVVGNRKEHRCVVPDNFRIVYSVEEHPLKDGSGFAKLRHASISVPDKGKLPNPHACEMIIMELGYKNRFLECMVDIEEGRAVNIIEVFQ